MFYFRIFAPSAERSGVLGRNARAPEARRAMASTTFMLISDALTVLQLYEVTKFFVVVIFSCLRLRSFLHIHKY